MKFLSNCRSNSLYQDLTVASGLNFAMKPISLTSLDVKTS